MDCFSIYLSIRVLSPCKLSASPASGVRLEMFNDALREVINFLCYEPVSLQPCIMRAKLQSSPIHLLCLDLYNTLLQL